MGVNLTQLDKFTITDLSGGLNQFASSYKVSDNEVIFTKNVSFKDSGSVRVRLGEELLDPLNTSGINVGIRSMHRYTSSFGGRITMMYDDEGYIWTDSDFPNSFTRVPSSTDFQIPSYDGKCRFAQHYDTVIFGTDRAGHYLYNPNISTIGYGDFKLDASTTGVGFPNQIISSTGGFLDSGDSANGNYYYYLFTVDYQYDNFMGESQPLFRKFNGTIYHQVEEVNITSGSTNKVQFQKYQNPVFTVPDEVARINVYRSSAYPSPLTQKNIGKREYFYIGSVDIDTYNAASNGDVLFEDTGQSAGKLVEYNKMERPPRGRHIANHKGRIWMADVLYGTGSVEDWANADVDESDYERFPHRVFASSINNSGDYEPAVFYTDQFVEIYPWGTGITGIHSFKNRYLVVFKSNSMWAIQGDDPHPSTGNLSVINISNVIGCISPESICEIEGRLVWLSNSGVYFWDGMTSPSPLKTDNIVDAIQGIPTTQKKDVVSVYDKKQRELLMAFSDAESEGYNRKVAKFDVRTSAWAIDEYKSGYGAFVTVDEQVEGAIVYGGHNDIDAKRILYGTISQLNTGTVQRSSPSSSEAIPFEFQTKFYDGGLPYMDKHFQALLIDLKTPVDLTLHVLCDDRLDTRDDDSGFTISLPSQNALVWALSSGSGEALSTRWYRTDPDDVDNNQLQNDNRWAKISQGTTMVYLDDRCYGKRISLIISGSVSSEVNIDSITVFYKPLAGVRGN